MNNLGVVTQTSERQRKLTSKFHHANLVFQACISLLRCFRTPGAPLRKIPACTGNLLPISGSFRSRSGADQSLDLLGPKKPNFKET